MERREQYDPEDIESLLQERGFDDLLEEERAYVLRHLSGREEYEQMRALLRHVREDDRQHKPLEADENVRVNVIQAFRAQQRPQWKVWLNTVGGLFTPGEGFAMWRPALAIGMIMLLFGVGFFLIRGPIASDQQQLAEVRRQKAEEPLPVKKQGSTDTNTAITSSITADTTSDPETSSLGSEVSQEKVTPVIVEDQTSAGAASAEAPVETFETVDAAELFEPVAEENKMQADHMQSTAPTSGHVVTEEEFARNYSLANASGKVQVRSAKENAKTPSAEKAAKVATTTASRSVAQDPVLLDLLSAGW